MNRCVKLVFVVVVSVHSYSQTISLNLTTQNDYYRRLQLVGDSSVLTSLMIRPIAFLNNTAETSDVSLLPVVWKQQYTSNYPVGFNDGIMIPATGYQTQFSTGFFAKWGVFSVQLMPELVYAQNTRYQTFPVGLPDNVWRVYNRVKNAIDVPERFGNELYRKIGWGQSSARITYKSLSLGVSNENLWWGPGIQNSLIMTNNAPGFKHITFNTVKPVNTPIGKFEWQIIGGKLEASGYPGVDTTQLRLRNIRTTAKKDDWRYLNAMSVNYQPKWLTGLSLGLSRGFTLYSSSITKNYRTYLPLLEPLFKLNVGGIDSDTIASDQIASVYARWMDPKSNYEIYLEYGRADHSWDITDFLLEPGHYRAYVGGFRKLVPINKPKQEYLDLHVELTQMGRNLPSRLRIGNTPAVWYVHGEIRHGYTHEGQILGSGMGPSSNMQSLSISWVRNMKKVGFEFTRLLHDYDFWIYMVQTTGYGSYDSPWVDISASFVADWDYKNFLMSLRLKSIRSMNYMYLYDTTATTPPNWWDNDAIRRNFHAELTLVYLIGGK